jgi:hypothetical protein
VAAPIKKGDCFTAYGRNRHTVQMPHENSKAAYERLRAAPLESGTGLRRGSRDADSIGRTNESRTIRRRNSDHCWGSHASARRSTRPGWPTLTRRQATIEDLARLPPMAKQDAQEDWDAIITIPEIDRAGAERVLAEQRWFSYTAAGLQVFSSGGSSGCARRVRLGLGAVRNARLSRLAVAGTGRPSLPGQASVGPDWPCSRPASRHTPARRCSMSRPGR